MNDILRLLTENWQFGVVAIILVFGLYRLSHKLEFGFQEVRNEIKDVRKDMEFKYDSLQTQLAVEGKNLRAEFKSGIQELRTELKTEINELRTELQELRVETRTEIQGLRNEMTVGFLKIENEFKLVRGEIRENQMKTDHRHETHEARLKVLEVQQNQLTQSKST